MTPQEIKSLLEKSGSDFGFSHFGITTLERPLSFDFYQQWIQEGYHGDMKYLSEHAAIKENPQKKWPRAQSALVFAMPYFPHPEQSPRGPLKVARTSLHAQGMDYHFWFKERMQKICVNLQEFFPQEEFVPLTDSSPVLERDLARRASFPLFQERCRLN